MSKKANPSVRLPEGLEDDIKQYAELNPGLNLESNDPRIAEIRQILLMEWLEIFYEIDVDEKGQTAELKERGKRATENRLKLYKVGLRARIQGLLGNELWKRKGPATPAEFKASPRTKEKTEQEITAHKAERMAFDREDPEIVNDEAQDHLNIDPNEVTDTLLTNLGLSEYIPGDDLNPVEQLARRAEAIPAVRAKWRKLEPIQRSNESDRSELKYFRLMRMTEGETEGAVLGTQMIGDNKILFRTTLDGAERRLLNIEVGYEEEIKLLKFIESVLRHVQENLGEWKKLTPEEIGKIKTSLLQCVDSLEHVQNEHKKALRSHIRGCLNLRDIRNRNNPSAIMAKLNAAIPFVGDRLKEIGEIWRYIGNDKARVHELKEEEKAPLINFCTEVEELHEQFKILKPEEGALMDEGKKDRVIRNLDERKAESAELRFEPYLSFGRKFIAQIDIVKAALQENNFDAAAREFVKLYLITKIDRAYEEIAAIHLKISAYPHLIQPEGLQAEIEAKREAFGQRPVASEIEIDEYRDSYDEVYHLYNSLCARLRELLTPQTDSVEEASTTQKPEKSSHIDDIMNSLQEILPEGLNNFVDKIRTRVNSFMFRVTGKLQPATTRMPQATAGERVADKRTKPVYTKEEAEETYAKMKARIKEFPFAQLVRDLPDTPTAPIAPPAIVESAAS